MTFPPMRPQIEIQRVHDMLMTVLSTPRLAQFVVPQGMERQTMMAADCLCWVLHHDTDPDAHPDTHAVDFRDYIAHLFEVMGKLGDFSEPPGEEYIIEE